MTATELLTTAPRLCRAWYGIRENYRAELRAADKRLRADRLLAHRELQFLRAANLPPSKGSRKYLAHRERKLRQAQGIRRRAA